MIGRSLVCKFWAARPAQSAHGCGLGRPYVVASAEPPLSGPVAVTVAVRPPQRREVPHHGPTRDRGIRGGSVGSSGVRGQTARIGSVGAVAVRSAAVLRCCTSLLYFAAVRVVSPHRRRLNVSELRDIDEH
jgi:hypothetical protein